MGLGMVKEYEAVERFLKNPDQESFGALFALVTPQLVAFFRKRGHEAFLAEDLAQEVMLTVYLKAHQVRDRTLFRGWLFKVARHAACRHFERLTREVSTVDLEDVGEPLHGTTNRPGGGPAFEFRDWMTFLEPHERDVMTLRFVEEWEYHEIAAAQAIPIGTVQWQVFNSKKKLAVHLNRRQPVAMGKAA